MAGDYCLQDYFNKRVAALELERQSFIEHYREISLYMAPRRGRFTETDVNRGIKRHQAILNSKPIQSHRIARAGMLAGIMSPSRPWFMLATPDPDMMEYQPVRLWLEKVELLLRAVFNQSNLYNMAPVMIGELLLFGTGAMSHVDDFDDVARFYSHTAGSYMIAQNSAYRVDTLVRKFMMTASQMIGEYGMSAVSPAVKTAYDNSNYEAWFPVTHFVEPNPDYSTASKRSAHKKFRSVYYETTCADKDKVLRNAGFDEFPAYCPRWDLTGEDVYATDCPGMTTLGDVKGLQILERRRAQGIDKMVNPPLSGPPSVRNQPAAIPGSTIIYTQEQGGNKLEPIYKVEPRLQELMLDIQRHEQRIDTGFYVDLFLAISNMQGIQPRNQEEILQRNEERLLQIGPVLERLHGEFLSPLIDRTFNQCARAGLLPPPPKELQGKALKVDFISSLAQAQRAVAGNAVQRLAAYVGGLVQGGVNDGKKFDSDQSIDIMAEALGVPSKAVVSDEVVAQQRQAEQKAAAAQQAAQMAQSMANTAKMASDAKTSDPSVLTAAMGQ